jgi:hypothetical protein
MAFLYYNMACSVTIGALTTTSITAAQCKESYTELSNVATITLPRECNFAIKGRSDTLEQKNIRQIIKAGDPVILSFGYDENIFKVFTGYVKKISADIPLVIECEDEMFKLRKSTFNESFKSIKLIDLLNKVAPGYTYNVIDNIDLGKFMISNASGYQVLEALRKDYLLQASFEGKELTVGFPIDLKPQKTHKYNINRLRSASSLEFVSKDDFKLEIKAISNNSDGTKEVVTIGESGGSVRTLNFANKSKEDLESLAKKQIDSTRFDGYQGSFDAFGDRHVMVGDAVELDDPNYPNSERAGKYLVESVERTFDENGIKQTIKPSLKL